ncbi:DMT family transporter [Desulfobacterales bacterium HSG16]|nr:DMT family transporter [Desulfobacterales bacterium HSG16]
MNLEKSLTDSPQFNPYFALIAGVCAVSTGAIFARLADAPALVIAAYRVGLAVLIISPFAWYMAKDELKALSKKELGLSLLAGLFLALHFATWISSLSYTSVANSVVLVNTNPLWVGLLTPLITKEKLGRLTILGIVISVIGGIIIGMGDFATGKDALLGDGLALAGSVCAAFYILLGRKLRKKLSLVSYIFVCYGSAALILWFMVLVAGLPFTGFSNSTYTAFWAMALIPQLIGHTSYNWSLKWFSANMIAISLLGEPVGASIMAYFLFGENISILKFAGGVLILSGIYFAAVGESSSSGNDNKNIDKERQINT